MRLPELDFAYDEPDVGYSKIRLHFNENLFLPEEYYREVAPSVETWELRYYTDPNNKRLATKIETRHGLPQGSVVSRRGPTRGLGWPCSWPPTQAAAWP